MKLIITAIVLFLLQSCTTKKVKDAGSGQTREKMALIDADKAFSDLSVQKGMKTAFIEYIDSNGVLLRPGHLPIIGAGAIDYLIQQNDTTYTLEWEPQYAYVASSLDLGYTYGLYALRPKAKDTVLYGTYVSIWKKQGDGKWKFVLDSGNDGVGEIQ